MSINFIALIAVAVVAAMGVASVVMVLLAAVRGGKKPQPDAGPVPTSLSFLAGLSFFSGLGAMALVVVAAILSTVLTMGNVLQVDPDVHRGFSLATKIVLYASLLPAVAAVAFALAARGVISEGRGAVRGRPLYRTGILLAVLSGAVVVDARVVNPATWAEAGRSIVRRGSVDEREINRGYLGVELEGPTSGRVLRVVPGSPAERAGIQPGDWIDQFDGYPSTHGAGIIERIGSLKPGTKVPMTLRRGSEKLNVTAELAASIATLLSMLERQDFDDERLDVLKAAGLDHRYSAEELTKICAAFDFDDGRLKAIERALPHLQDPPNAYRILGALEFSDAKSKVSGWITAVPKPPKKPQEE